MPVPYSFGAATSAIPLSQLDANFNTPITLGNTAIQLGNTVTTLNNMTLANVTISSGNVTLTNVTVTTANATTVNTTTLIATTANITTDNVTNFLSANVAITGGSITSTPISGSTGSFTTLTTSSTVTLNGGTANGVGYLNGSKVLTTGSALTFDGSGFGVGGNAGAGVRIYTRTAATTGTAFQADNGVNTGFVARFEPSLTLIGNDFSQPLAFLISNTEQMRLTSTGLGIGTSSPAFKLDVNGRTRSADFALTANTNYYHFDNYSGSNFMGLAGGTSLQTYVGGALRTTLDSSGNLGLGVTPSAWASGWPALQVGTGAALWSTSDGRTSLGSNTFVGSGPTAKYIGNGFASSYAQLNGVHSWYIAPNNTSGAGATLTATQAMTLDASGNLLVGTTSASFASGGGINVKNASTSNVRIIGGSSTGFDLSQDTGGNTYVYNRDNGFMAFATNNTERARITSGGYFKASNNGTYINSAGTYNELNQTANSEALIVYARSTSQSAAVLDVYAERDTTNNTYYPIGYYNNGASVYRFRVADSGNVTNTNGSYGTISDAKMKTDIVDAGSQWADIKAIRFRKFKMKDDSAGLVQLGVVAQELEQTSPGLVEEHTDRDREGNDLGTTTKSVKTSVLLMKAAVALQEAMVRIEKLEAEVAALKGA